MSQFKSLTSAQVQELEELLEVADVVLGRDTPVVKGNKKAASIIGTAIGGATGAALASSATVTGLAGTTVGLLGGVAFSKLLLAGGVIGLPILGWFIFNNKQKTKEQQRQANYYKDIAEKQQEIYDKYVALKKEHERTDKKKDDLIKEQREKIAEYEAVFEALKKKGEELEENLASA